VADQLSDGRRFRALTVVDVYTGECLAMEVGQSVNGPDVVRVLQRIEGALRSRQRNDYGSGRNIVSARVK